MHNSDIDPIETQEWLDALHSVCEEEGKDRAAFLLSQVMQAASQLGVVTSASLSTPYRNTLPDAVSFAPLKDQALLEKLTNVMRWNAIAMVMRAGRRNPDLGGHIASFGAIATLFEVGFQHFFHAPNGAHGGDLVYFQGHSSPGVYARAFLEGRLTTGQLDGFRQEISTDGLSSYPHPWLMPDFWQFPTVSMGLGPLMAIYQARFLRYLDQRGLAKTECRRVWAYCGDGELGEPESLGALNLAGREKLDNLTFVISCNLQRLDGPVWGNGQIIQEYESVFRGAGWHVIKVILGSAWQPILARDTQGLVVQRMAQLLDGEYQRFSAGDGAYWRQHFFGVSSELAALVADLSDEVLAGLRDGGHDPAAVHAAYAHAVAHSGQPTVILAKTVKGYGMGNSGEAKNVTHQTKKIAEEDLKHFRTRFDLPLSDEDIQSLNYYKPPEDSPEMKYLHAQREKLGGYLPQRTVAPLSLPTPDRSVFSAQLDGTGERQVSTTMAFVRILRSLLREDALKSHIVPILADESRTFGMEGLFRQIGIYAAEGQKYEPEDNASLSKYFESRQGQLLQEGISEAGAMSSWIAAATSYASNQLPMVPFYIYYSMFGFQRFGDLVWAAGDMRARGFILGATAGRTTLAGEGLQHQDGHNLLMFSMVPNCVSYDPTFAYELAVIVRDGIRRMMTEQEDVFYYITLMNENYIHPAMPEGEEENILKGMYCFRHAAKPGKRHVQLMGSGTIFREVIAAAEWLETEVGVTADLWSVTSFNVLRRDLENVNRHNRLHPDQLQQSHVRQQLAGRQGPVIAATDYMKLYADQIRSEIDAPYYVLGTDGFGRSDGRAALRSFFEVDANMIAYTAMRALYAEGVVDRAALAQAAESLNIDADRMDPVTC